jgi:Fic family protein
MEKAVSYMENAVKNSAELTEDFIQELNAYVLKNINDDMAGVYRNVNVRITGASFSPPAPQEVRILMGNLIAQYYSDLYISLHPVERAAKLHTDFVRIHPFEDGNGRTARLLMNYELRKNGFPMISIKDRVEYINALETYNVQGALEDLSTMIAQEVVNEQELIKNHSIEK